MKQGLCFRCEHRARFLEDGSRPRYECGDVKSNKYVCYMYRPVLPVVLDKLDKTDKRPQFGPPMISSRSMFVRVAEPEMELSLLSVTKSKKVLYWRPKDEQK